MKPQRIENLPALDSFFASLCRTELQEPEAFTRIIHYGDSHVAADWLTGKMRRNFYNDFARGYVSYETKGINGARATNPLSWNWETIRAQFTATPPTLIIIAYGTNEVGDADLDLEEYKRIFCTLLERFKTAAPDASLLVIAPPDRAIFVKGKWKSLAKLPALIQTQRAAALSEGAAFWDQYQAMGGTGSINRWANLASPLAQKDRVHLTKGGYKRIADALYQELTDEFHAYLLTH